MFSGIAVPGDSEDSRLRRRSCFGIVVLLLGIVVVVAIVLVVALILVTDDDPCLQPHMLGYS